MSRELQDGDAVRAVFERSRSPSGLVRIGAILAAGLERSGAELQAIRFVPAGEDHADYYDQDGRSLRSTHGITHSSRTWTGTRGLWRSRASCETEGALRSLSRSRMTTSSAASARR